MIRITYNMSNRVILPLDQNGYGPYYLFEIYSEWQNEIVKTFVTVDNSTASERAARYNDFTFREVGIGGTEDFYGGAIRLLDGTYLLRVYQQSSSGNLIPSGTIIYCDTLKVYGNPTEEYLEYEGMPTDFTPYNYL